MAITEDLRKTLTDTTPFYAFAGASDLAAEKLRTEVPALIDRIRAEAPERIAAVRATDPKIVQERMAKQAKEAQATVQSKMNELLGTLDTDIKKLREQAQGLALQGVGRVAEAAVRTRETYDELAERGRGVVQTWRGETADHVEDLAAAIEADPKPMKPESTTAKATPAAKPARPAGPAKSEPASAKANPTPKKPAAQRANGKKATPPTQK